MADVLGPAGSGPSSADSAPADPTEPTEGRALRDTVAAAMVMVTEAPPGIVGIVGIGVDLVELARMRRVLERTPGFVHRVFTAEEAAYCAARRDPVERYAVRFAAKEAVLKAMGLGLWAVPLSSIEVRRDDETGRPWICLHDDAVVAADSRGITGWQLSLTHTTHHAVAVVAALGTPET